MKSELPRGWEKTELGKAINLRRGHDLTRKNMNDKGVYPVMGSNGIIGKHNKFILEGPVVTVGRSGNVGTPFYYEGSAWPHNTTLYIDDFKGNNSYFIYYLLVTLNLKNYAGGSAVPTLNRNHIHPISINLAPLKEQKAIAGTLSSIDNKIELNNKINKNLETQAQAIFKHWFVDFEFPDENGKPYKSSGGEMVESELGMIPKGWKVVKCGDKFNFVKGKVPKYADNLSESVMPYLNKGALDGNWEDIRYGYKDTGVYCEPLDVLMMMDGSSSSDIFYGYEGLVGSTLSLIDAEDDNVREILYMYFKAFNNELKNQNTGSAIPHANKDFINNIKLAIPKLDSEFSDISIIFKNIRIQVLSNQQQNEKLAQLRDILLPKLMSGEIRIVLD